MLIENRKDIKSFKALLAEKARLDNEYGEALVRLSESYGKMSPHQSSVAHCMESIRDTLRIFGEKHVAKATMFTQM
jgi:hypothetical protein